MTPNPMKPKDEGCVNGIQMHTSSIKEILDKVMNKGKPDRRCMVCKYWKPVTECTGLCTYSDRPFYKHPNYVCSKFEPYK